MATTTKSQGGRSEAPPTTEGAKAGGDTPEVETTGEGLLEAQEQLFETGYAPKPIYQRMLAILAELPAIGKNQKNTQQNFMFRGHDDVLNALNPLLAKHGVFIVPQVIDRVTDQRTTGGGKVMFEVNLHVEYRFWGADGDFILCSTWGEGTDMGDKATNKAMTMAFKNALNQAFAIATEEFKDSDAETPESVVPKGSQSQAEPKRDARKAERLTARIVELASALDVQTQKDPGSWALAVEQAVATDYGVPMSELKDDELVEVGKFLKARIDEGVTEMPDPVRIQPF